MTTKQVIVSVTDKNAIYVDGYRITDRGTKWGLHRSLEEFTCDRDEVVAECVRRGYTNHVRRIDEDVYIAQRELLQ